MTTLPPQRYGDAASTLAHLRKQSDAHADTVRDILGHLNSTPEAFSGEAADAARARFEGLATIASRISADALPGEGVLRTAHLLEQVALRIIAAVRPLTPLVGPVGATATITVFDTERDRTTLNYAVAAALRGVNLSVEEPSLDRLYNHPELTLAQLHSRHMATIPPEVAEVVSKHEGVILEAGSGGIAVLVGDAERAPETVMTLVAGTGSSSRDGLDGYLERGRTMARHTGSPTVVWLGYSAPDNVAEAALRRYSNAAGDDLSYFQAALRQRYPEATHTVVGHSYGTVVVGEAAATHGLHADNVVLLGSPGVPVATARDMTLHSDDPHVLVADTPNDLIDLTRDTLIAWHGVNPRSPLFGAEVMTLRSWDGHSGHWDDAGLWERVRELNQR